MRRIISDILEERTMSIIACIELVAEPILNEVVEKNGMNKVIYGIVPGIAKYKRG